MEVVEKNGRGEWIRTIDLLVPKIARTKNQQLMGSSAKIYEIR